MRKEKQAIETGDTVEESRRKFLMAAGRIAVYTPPAMLVMSQPSYAGIKTTGGQTYDSLQLQTNALSCTSPNGPSTKNIVRRFCEVS